MKHLINWITKLSSKQKPVVPKRTIQPPKGYIIYTDKGGVLNCTSQRIVAETLSVLYNIPLNRDHVHHALSRYNGKLSYKGIYIATIKYKEEI